jgi:hypothetical protein
VTHRLLSQIGVMALQILLRSQVSQGLMRPDGIVHPFPFEQRRGQVSQIKRAVSDLIEFLGVGPLGPFDMPAVARYSLGFLMA